MSCFINFRKFLILLQSFLLLLMTNASALSAPVKKIETKATFYSDKYVGKKTASGQRYNPHAMTAASNKLPIGSKVLVENKKTGKATSVVITDKGGTAGRAIDLSKAAAKKIGVTGVAPVEVKVLKTKRLTASNKSPH